MENYLILGTIAIIAVVAIGTLIKRAGRKGCCGCGSDYKARIERVGYTVKEIR